MADEHMTAADEEFFELDRDPRTVSTIGVVYVFDEDVSDAALVEALGTYASMIPRARQRVVRVGDRLAWRDAPDWDHADHVTFASLGGNGSEEQLEDVVSRQYSRPWDMSAPLVRATVVRGLAGGRSCVMIELSHALGDGLGLLRGLRGREAADGAGTGRHALADALRATSRNRALHELGSFSRHALEVGVGRRRRRATGSSARRIAFFRVPLESWRRAAERRDGRITDLFVAAAATTMRDALGAGAALPTVNVVLPVSLRAEDEAGTGNQVWRGLVRLPAGDDLLARLGGVAHAVREARAPEHLPVGPLPADLLQLAPPRVRHAFMRRSLAEADVVATNLKFRFEPIEFAGAPVAEHHVIAPVTGPPALFALCTYGDVAHFSLTLDPAMVPDPARVRRRFAEIVHATAQESGA